MHAELTWKDPKSAGRIHPNDAKRIVRALEVHHATGVPISELQQQWDVGAGRYECVMIGLRRTKEDLHSRINQRVKKMIEAGLRDEVARLMAEPVAISLQAAQAVGYAEMFEHLRGRCTLEDAVEAIKINTRRLAKKQRSWHRRWAKVQWFDCQPNDTAEDTAHQILERLTFE